MVMALVYLIAGLHLFRHQRRPNICGLILAFTWLLAAAFEWRRQLHQRDFEPGYAKGQTFELEEDGLFRDTVSAARVKVPLTKISRYVETDEFFPLASPWPWGIEKPEKPSPRRKQDKPVLFILPKRAFASADIERFRDLLQRKLSVWAKNPRLQADTILTA